MKKAITLLLALVMVLSLAACGNSVGGNTSGESSDGGGQKKIEPIELTIDNIENYLAFRFNYSKVTRETKIGMSFGYTDLTTDVYSTASGSFDNVEMTVEISLSNGWSVSSSDEAYDKNNDEVLTLNLRLPSNGTISETHDLIASLVFRDPDSKNVNYKVTSVSGTFTPAN